MKCPNPNCDWSGEGNFCEECGGKMMIVPPASPLVVICDGQLYDGSTCGEELVINKKFCGNCGKKIDPSLFIVPEDICKKCGTKLEESKRLCTQCGGNKLRESEEKENVCRNSSALQNTLNETTLGTVNKTDPDSSTGDTCSEKSTEVHDKVEECGNQSYDDLEKSLENIQLKEGEENRKENMERLEENLLKMDSSDDERYIENLLDFNENSFDDKDDVTEEVDDVTNADSDSGVKTDEGREISSDKGTIDVDFDDSDDRDVAADDSEHAYDEDSAKNDGADYISSDEDTGDTDDDVQTSSEEEDKLEGIEATEDVDMECEQDENGETRDQTTTIIRRKRKKKGPGSKAEQIRTKRSRKEKARKEKATTIIRRKRKKKGPGSKAEQIRTKRSRKEKARAEKLTETNLSEHSETIDVTISIKDYSVDVNSTLKNNLNDTAQIRDETSNKGLFTTHVSIRTSDQDQNKVFGSDQGHTTYVSSNVDTGNSEIESETIPTFFKKENSSVTIAENHQSSTGQSEEKGEQRGAHEDLKNASDNRNNTNRTKSDTDQQNRSQQQGQQSGQHTNTRSDTITVVFHVLIENDLREDPTNNVLIRFGDKDLGGWYSTEHVMKEVRTLKKHTYFRYETKMAKYNLRGDMYYKYYIQKSGALSKDEEHKCWENYYDSNSSKARNNHHNRRLYVYEHLSKGKDVWDQFDGIATVKTNEWFLEKTFNIARRKFEKDSANNAAAFVREFCPAWFKPDFDVECNETVQESVDRLESLMHCMRTVYVVDANCWKKDRDEKFKRMIGHTIFTPMIEKVNDSCHLKHIRAAAIILACQKCELTLSENEWQIVCHSLLMPIEFQQKTCDTLKVLMKYIPFKGGELQRSLVTFMGKSSAHGKNPSWWYCLPLLHFISGVCKPFEAIKEDLSYSAAEPRWWGTFAIKECVKQFQNAKGKWTIPLHRLWDELQPHFEADYFLPRSIVACLTPEELHELLNEDSLPPEVCCACVLHWMKLTKPVYSYYNNRFSEIDTQEQIVNTCVSKLKSRVQTCSIPNESKVVNWSVTYKVAQEMAFVAGDRNRLHPFFDSVQLMIHSASAYDKITHTDTVENRPVTRHQNDHRKRVSAMEHLVLTWLNKYTSSYWLVNMQNNFQMWNEALIDTGQDDEVVNTWNTHICNLLQNWLNSLFRQDSHVKQKFVEHYCQAIDLYCKPFQETMGTLAFQAIEHGYNLDTFNLGDREKIRFGSLLSDLFERHWMQTVGPGDDHDGDKVFEMVINWPPFHQFITHTVDQQSQILNTATQNHLVFAMAIIKSRKDDLFNGTIDVGTLRLIAEKRDVFGDIIQLISSENKNMKHLIDNLLKVRMTEIETFEQQARQMTVFVSRCRVLVDTKAIDDVLKKVPNIGRQRVEEFCIPKTVDVDLDVSSFEPRLTAFMVDPKVLQILPRFEKIQQSLVFEKVWHAQCSALTEKCCCVEDVVKHVLIPVEERLMTFSKNVQSGEITFQEMEQMIGNTLKSDQERMYTEMELLGVPVDKVRTRVDQLKENRELGACLTGSKVILKFKDEYQLTGNFEPINNIASHTERTNFKMNEFDGSLMKTCGVLKDVTEAKAKCLDVFVECGDLVKWLKESMKTSGQKELKVFVDLAMMAVGDEPLNIKKVQCLHSAVIGYAPLIFDLTPECDYVQLLDMCRTVWREFDANPKLPKQLEDTNRELKWLQEIKKAHGSVEVTSLMQAEAINADGVYTVGRHAWNIDTLLDLHTMTTRDTIKLTVPGEKGKSQLRNYSFSQLQDLQSRLMLVAGKAESGNVNVERFTMIFDGIIRLSNVYTTLCSSGCVLFNNWTATFLCSPDQRRLLCATLEFGEDDDMPQLKGRKHPEEQLEQMIPAIANFMEICLEEWLSHIREKRKTYFHLNYFTIDQLVILQRELVKMGTEEEPSDLIYPLLSAVKENCTQGDVTTSMSTAKREINGIDDMNIEEVLCEAELDETMSEQKDDENRRQFIQELVDIGYSKDIATRSCDHVSAEEIDEHDISGAIVWCIRNESNVNEDEGATKMDVTEQPVTAKASADHTFSGWTNTHASMETLIKDTVSSMNAQQKKEFGVKPLMENLQNIWRTFLDSIDSQTNDYLSLEHLGVILKHLAGRDVKSIERSLPLGLVEGQPNLIICPSDDIFSTTLSLYMCDENQPLPQSDEVLVCTANTAKDEVDIFWRRAIFDTGKKIHCLVHADLLGFDVSEAAEQCLEDYLQDTHHDKDKSYRLVVICGSENEYRSGIVSSLDKFRRQVQQVNNTVLLNFVTDKFTQPCSLNTHEEIKSAACVDSQRLSARLVKSSRAGVGKTLFMKRRESKLAVLNKGRSGVKVETVTIPLQEKHIHVNQVTQRLLNHVTAPDSITTRIFHIDISHEVQEGIDYFLFNLLILNCLVDKSGYVWRRCSTDLYLIETMPIMTETIKSNVSELHYVHPMFNILPDVVCRSPQDSLNIYSGQKPDGYKDSDQLFDEQQFRSSTFQRPFQYLARLDQNRNLNDVQPQNPEETQLRCLQVFLKHCGVQDPSWSEIHHFVWFLNTQLVDFEQNQFVSVAANEDLPGFAKFVLRFLMQMSRDFSTRSLNMSEESPGLRTHERMEVDGEQIENEDLDQYQMRRTWESSPHPYLFFNSDRFTFTFLGFYIDKTSGNLVDLQTRNVLENAIMTRQLYEALERNRVPIQENFDNLPRDKKILKLCKVMGIDMEHDPDDTYELTTDNVKKIMAIYMRFRCDIPVIIMGETGCGKTRLIKFMCALQSPPGEEVQNMILMKVHGGTSNSDIERTVRYAEKIAKKNTKKYGPHMYTVLFFDEANTTESIGLIKEIMCDKSIEGRKLKVCDSLKMVAACNPYRKHSDEMITKLEQAGLGYHVDADKTTDRLGRVPMRRLVYRVQPLPQSLLPLVWDFGQLDTQVEDLYIRQMVRRYIREKKLPNIPQLVEVVSQILTSSQEYMRDQKDECSFVSLRDVDRVLTVMSWFYERAQGDRTLFNAMDEKRDREHVVQIDQIRQPGLAVLEEDSEDEEEVQDVQEPGRVNDITRSLILALGVCYHACLKTRKQYRETVAHYFKGPCQLHSGADQILYEIDCCQDVFLDNVDLDQNIARNMALKENIFMMVVCIELRIPLFLVGKPGSSKSLAKTIVSDAMQGNSAKHVLFKNLKQVQMVSFQCSPLSTPDGIVGTFKQCAQFQKDKDLNSFVSVVVLDEVGLAEDSPRMPLKTLHPLLEEGYQEDKTLKDKDIAEENDNDNAAGDDQPDETVQPLLEDDEHGAAEEHTEHNKVAFIGISNWALDPAKMNRGILVQREVPDLEELQNSAKGICKTSEELDTYISPLIEPLSKSYLEIFEKASQEMREFFGLRDFYSLVKMVYGFVEKSKQKPTWFEMLHAIKRNFGGLDQVDPVECFKTNLASVLSCTTKKIKGDPDCSASGLVQACLFDTNQMKSESRYLLLLTENYGALSIIQQQILAKGSDIRPITIFGSSFRSDQEYTQVCRNINKIKVCMETGNTVVLLNLENLYESLYDALNQYYVYFGGERYVDLGLGTHRVKCPVHRNFRLIVVAEKATVYEKFPIPLINRLEKHFLNTNTLLNERQLELAKKLEQWAKDFAEHSDQSVRQDKASTAAVEDVFIGYHEDTCSAVVLHVSESGDNLTNEEVLLRSKQVLLWSATPESVMKIEKTKLLPGERKILLTCYNKQQSHGNFIAYLRFKLLNEKCDHLFAQITTHSKLLAGVHRTEISKAVGIATDRILLLETLSSFDTEQQFSNRIRQHLQVVDKDPCMMVIQCDSGDVNANLIACARYCVMDEYEKLRDQLRAPAHVVFIVQLPRKKGGCFTGFQCGIWHSAHIDELYPEDETLLHPEDMYRRTVADLFQGAAGRDTEGSSDRVDICPEKMDCKEAEDNLTELAHSPDTREAMMEIDNTTCTRDILDTSDIKVDFADHEWNQEQNTRPVNIDGLVKKCIQSALSMVKDRNENKSRETERVKIVLNCLDETKFSENAKSFLRGLAALIGKLLGEKNKTRGDYLANMWLENEAAAQENINKAGTFRRSCLQTLVAKVSPILAGIIGYLDTNQNLDILIDGAPWKQSFWLVFLNADDAVQLQYEDLISPMKRSDLKDVIVTAAFKAKLPFSWVIIDTISVILKQALPENNADEHFGLRKQLEVYGELVMNGTLGQLLNQLTRENCGDMDQQTHFIQEVMNDYVHDFVLTFYNSHSEQESKIIQQSLMFKTKQMCEKSGSHGNLVMSLICVQFAYDTLAPRFSYFHSMNSVWPQCSAAIVDVKEKKPDHFMFAEDEFTFAALCLLIENLTPQRNELNDASTRTAWLNKVHRYRPVIEKVISLHREDPNLYGVHSEQTVKRAKYTWNRVLVMKLFIEDVCVTDLEGKFTIKHCMPLWKFLGDDVDLKEEKTIAAVETFLKTCNMAVLKEHVGSQVTCCNCEMKLDGPPLTLPCGDILCNTCVHERKALDKNNCPKCKKQLKQNWDTVQTQENRTDKDKLAHYQKRCNTFFMDIVSQLCFSDMTPPSQPVINKLLGYITCASKKESVKFTKEMTIFDTGVDPNPVFRSFLLQLLMKTSEESVREHLERYFMEAKDFLREDKNKDLVELSLLIMQCLEDILVQQTLGDEQTRCRKASYSLQHAQGSINARAGIVQNIYGIAHARMGLSTTAKHIAHIVKNNIDPLAVSRDVRKLIENAQTLCERSESEWPKIYLVKYLCRCYGIDIYQAVCRRHVHFLRWMEITNMDGDQNLEVSDRYIVTGDKYTKVREAVTKVILGEDVNHLEEHLLEFQTAGIRVELYLQLAIHREITCANYRPQQQRQGTPQTFGSIVDLMGRIETVRNKTLMGQLLQNWLLPIHLVAAQGLDLRHQGLQCLIVHYMAVMSRFDVSKTLLNPLISLMKTPQTTGEMLLPTMPQDDLDDVREAVLAARGQNENPVIYRCPAGHPYLIGDCGRPYYEGICKECGQRIGGKGHIPFTGNVKDDSTDNTKPGHILGRPCRRGPPRPEREMTLTYCCVLRFLLHMAMYAGTAVNKQGIVAVIKPDILENEVEDFLWDHIQRDIDDLKRVLSRSTDDVLMTMHIIVNNVLTRHNEGNTVPDKTFTLQSKSGRQSWENQFAETFFEDTFQELDRNLKKYNQMLAKDTRLGTNPLLCILYETESQAEPEISEVLQEIPRVWRFRTPISIEHMRHEFEAKYPARRRVKQLGVLRLFLEEDHILRALQYIPGIMNLQRNLIMKYQRRLDKAEGNAIPLKIILKERTAGPETEKLLNDFKEVWELVREELTHYLCPTNVGGMVVPKEYTSKPIDIDGDTPLSVLLPTNKEAGLCSYAMLDLLFRKQNDFLDKYLKTSERSSQPIPTVQPAAVTSAHLISYNHDHDILPLILANCQYTFEMGKGTKIEYDFFGIERQLMDRFLFSKSMIDVGRVLEIEQMVYRTECTNSVVFKQLSDKISQKTMSAAVKTQICDELRSLPDVCRFLDNLDIAISFLKTTGGQQTTNLYDFMAKTLKIEEPMKSQKARQVCEFQHAKALWLLLSQQKSQLLVDYIQSSQEVFESLLSQFHEDLPEDMTIMFNDYMKNLSIDKLPQLLEALHEFLLLQVANRENREEEDFVDTTNNILVENLCAYVEIMDNPTIDIVILDEFPQAILFKHCVTTWITAYKTLKRKMGGQLRRH